VRSFEPPILAGLRRSWRPAPGSMSARMSRAGAEFSDCMRAYEGSVFWNSERMEARGLVGSLMRHHREAPWVTLGLPPAR
jgi:hypothetical protein